MGQTRAPIKDLPDRDELLRLFDYDPTTGILSWKSIPANFRRAKIGDEVGTINARGYRVVGIARVYYYAHRIIWKMVTGNDPVDQIDHIDGDRLNNRWENFREINNGKNIWNSKLRKDNTCGVKGVHFKSGRWRAVLGGEGKQRHLGCFATKDAAARAWRDAAEKQRGEYFRAG